MAHLDFSKLVTGAAAELPRLELLQSPADHLLGVSREVAKTLREALKVHSIFDLATSQIFNGAMNLVAPQNPVTRAALKDGLVPGDVLNQQDGAQLDPTSIGSEGIEKLCFNETGAAAKIKELLGLETIRDFALWTPFQTARALLEDTLGTKDENGDHHAASTDGIPADLVPKSGNMANQRAYYQSTYLIDDDLVHEGSEGHQTFDLGSEGQIDLLHTALTQEGFNEAALGVRVLSEQAWYTEGVTLGSMIHSLALTPGEVTRLSVTDWTQRTRGQRGEGLEQTADLNLDTSTRMAISEITHSVAQETQHGSNQTETRSDAHQSGGSGGFSLGFINFGGGGSSARNHSLSTSVSRSEGTRNLSAQSNRDINGRTHQHANATRQRKSAVIQETREDEGEQLTTRVIANYNHMHPLTMQYYEVVQNYRVATRAVDHERRLFVPLKLFDFKDPRVVLRYRAILEAIALDEEIKEKLAVANENNWREGHTTTLVDPSGNALHTIKFTDAQLTKIDYQLQGTGFIDGIQLVFNDGTMHNSGPGGIPGDTSGQASGSVFVDTNIPVSQLGKVLFDPDYAQVGNTLTLTYHFRNDNQTDSYTQQIVLTGDYCGYEAVHFQISKEEDETGAIQHLQENALYYSQGVWLNMDPTDWMKALLTVTYQGKPIAPTIEPIPVALLGNCVAFPWHFADEREKLDWLLETGLLDRDFKAWLAKHGHGQVTDAIKEEYLDCVGEPHGDAGLKETLVPISTGGIFAEAVLGRFNCAEKLDLTRFWNWQDSPIPIMPPEIDKLTANGHKGAAELLSDLAAAGFDPEAIQIHTASPQAAINAAAASAQSSTDALMQALTTANLFRDMSNAAATTELGAQSIQAAEAGAKAAGEQATENLKIAAEQYTQRLQMVADLAQQVLPLLLAPETGGASLLGEASTAGAAFNAAGKLDQAAGNGEGAQAAQGGEGVEAAGAAKGEGGTGQGAAGTTEGLSSIANVLGGLLSR